MLPGATSATASRFKPNAVRHAATFRGRRWRAFALLLALSAAVALGFAYVHETQANQRLRAMLQAMEQRAGAAAAGNGTNIGSATAATISTGDSISGSISSGASSLTGGVKAMFDSLLPSREDECEEHSALYSTIYNDLVPWLGRGITREDFAACDPIGARKEIGRVYVEKFAIIDNVIYCLDPPMLDWVNPLYFLSLADIQETVLRYGVPDLEFRLQFTDWPQVKIDRNFTGRPMGTEPACPLFSWVKDAQTLDILIPDGEFFKHHFDEWAANNSVNEPGAWAGKKDTAVGRFTNFPTGYRAPSRRGEVITPRNYYSDLSNVTGGSHLDVGMVEQVGFVPLTQQAGHKYALTVDGNTASTRLAMVLATEQVTLKHVSHYWMYYEAALQPWVHYVPVGQYDAKDILPIIDWLRAHDEDAHQIALAGQRFAQKHLTRPARLCYLRKLLHTYASLFRFQPKLADYANYTTLEEEFSLRFNDSDRFHTKAGRGVGWAQFFHWRKEEAEPHAAIPVTRL